MNTAVIAGSNVEGNIGSCSVIPSSYPVDFWYKEVVAVNSCSGEVVSKEVIFNGDIIFAGVAMLLLLAFIGAILRMIFDY